MLSAQLSDVHTICSEVVNNAWFFRTWTIQEYILSRRPAIGLIGGILFPLLIVGELEAAIMRSQTELRNAGVLWLPASWVRYQVEELCRTLRSSGSPNLSLVEQLLYFLTHLASVMCSEPHDQIYGVLGMIKAQNLPPELTPNYQTPFTRVCQNYARYIIENTGDLIFTTCAENRLAGVPSWVPDFRFTSGVQIEKKAKAAPSFSSDGMKLKVQGFRMQRVLGYSPKASTFENGLMDFNDTVLTASAWIRRRPLQDIFDEWMRQEFGLVYEDNRSDLADVRSIKDVVSSLQPNSGSRPFFRQYLETLKLNSKCWKHGQQFCSKMERSTLGIAIASLNRMKMKSGC